MTTLHLSPNDITIPIIRSKARGGVPIVLSLSAYDVPRSIKVDRDVRPGKMTIMFEYLNHETPDERPVDKHLAVIVGRETGKVLGFVIDPTLESPRDVIVRIVAGVEQQLRHATRDLQKLNYKVIQGVVSTKLESLLTSHIAVSY